MGDMVMEAMDMDTALDTVMVIDMAMDMVMEAMDMDLALDMDMAMVIDMARGLLMPRLAMVMAMDMVMEAMDMDTAMDTVMDMAMDTVMDMVMDTDTMDKRTNQNKFHIEFNTKSSVSIS